MNQYYNNIQEINNIAGVDNTDEVIGSLVISRKLKNQIDILHRKESKEWSGVLFIEELKKVDTLNNLEFKGLSLFLMDIGTSSNTGINYSDGSLMDAYDENPELIETKIGAIHTHHSMGAFFSVTDITDISSTGKLHNYYISLVVDYKGTYVAKIAIPVESESISKFKFRNSLGKFSFFRKKNKEKKILIRNLEIKYEEDEDISLIKRIETIKSKNLHTTNNFNKSSNNLNSYYNQGNISNWGVDYDIDINSNRTVDTIDNNVVNSRHKLLLEFIPEDGRVGEDFISTITSLSGYSDNIINELFDNFDPKIRLSDNMIDTLIEEINDIEEKYNIINSCTIDIIRGLLLYSSENQEENIETNGH